jgi:hypothetical protein
MGILYEQRMVNRIRNNCSFYISSSSGIGQNRIGNLRIRVFDNLLQQKERKKENSDPSANKSFLKSLSKSKILLC